MWGHRSTWSSAFVISVFIHLFPHVLTNLAFLYTAHLHHPPRAEVTDCVFPFEYMGKFYWDCLKTSNNRLWCSKDAVYEENRRWKYCPGMKTIQKQAIKTMRFSCFDRLGFKKKLVWYTRICICHDHERRWNRSEHCNGVYIPASILSYSCIYVTNVFDTRFKQFHRSISGWKFSWTKQKVLF